MLDTETETVEETKEATMTEEEQLEQMLKEDVVIPKALFFSMNSVVNDLITLYPKYSYRNDFSNVTKHLNVYLAIMRKISESVKKEDEQKLEIEKPEEPVDAIIQ